MKINEILIQEAISYTDQRDEFHSAISLVIETTTNRILESPGHDHDMMFDDFAPYIKAELRKKLSADLADAIADAVNSQPDIKAKVQFSTMNTPGAAGRDTIFLSNVYIKELATQIWKYLKRIMIDDGVAEWDEESEGYYVNVKEVAKYFKQYRYTVSDSDTSNVINSLVTTVIHELVHINQHSKQDGRDLEYRSYLMNRKKFLSAIKRMHDGIHTKIDNLAHASSPQEIPARAHDTAIEFINSVLDKNPARMTANSFDIRSLEYYILHMDARYIVNHTYQDFNKPGTNEYKIYRRFMKILTQEINAYRAKLEAKLEELKQSYEQPGSQW